MTATATVRARVLGILTFVLALACSTSARAQQPQLDTPRRTLELFLGAGAAGDFVHAAEALDLHLVRADQRRARGPGLAEQLFVVLRRAVWIDIDAVPDDPTLKLGAKSYRVATVPLGGRDVPLTLAMVTTASKDKEPRWLWSSSTVSLIPQLYDRYGPGVLESRLPPSVTRVRFGRLAAWQWVGIATGVPVGYVVGRFAAFLVYVVASRLTRRTRAKWDGDLVADLRGPTRLFCALVAFRTSLEPLTLPADALGTIGTGLKIAFIGVLGLAVMRVAHVALKTIEANATAAAAVNESETGALHARGVATQVRVLRRVLDITIGVLVLAMMLLQFETVRNVGVSLLASAGLAGIVLGLATQRTIGSLIAGIQLSATQPIRLGDQVIVEKEFGVIEEITLTYVVVRIWDERRLIVPMTRFLEQPFENWTKLGSQLHGTVMLYADPALPVSAVRAELDRLVEGDPRWDGRTKAVHVTDSDHRSMTLRVLVSARSAGDLFQLRANLREQLLAWLAALEGSRYMVRTRLEEREGDGARLASAPSPAR